VKPSNRIVYFFEIESLGDLLKAEYKKFPDTILKLFPLLPSPFFKGNPFFDEFIQEVLIETLNECKLNDEMLVMIDFVISLSSKKVSDELIQCLVENKHEINSSSLSYFTLIKERLSEDQSLFIVKKIEKMKESMLNIDQDALSKFLSINSSKKFVEVVYRFLLLILNSRMFPYLIMFPDAIGHYILSFLNRLSTEQFISLIPKIESKFSENNEISRYLGVLILDCFVISGFVEDLSLFTETKILSFALDILENQSFPNFSQYSNILLIRFFSYFISYFTETQNEKALTLLYQKSFEFLNSKDTYHFELAASCLFQILESHSIVKDFKPLPGGKEFLLRMKQLLEENQEEKLNLIYHLISVTKAFGENIFVENPTEISPIMNLLVKEMGNRLHLDENEDSVLAIGALFQLLKKDAYPWFEILMTKLKYLLKKELKSTNIQQVYIILCLIFMVLNFPDFMVNYIDSPGFLDLILKYSLVILV
jgi:hypothetical protein